MSFNPYTIILVVFGLAFLGASVLPRKLEKSFFTLPMVYLIAGIVLAFLWKDSPVIDPLYDGKALERVTEMAVIVALMGAGLKIDTDMGWKKWNSTWRLLAITMPFCISILALLGWLWLGLTLGAAVLLGASLAPTDPVMASGVQVGEPGEEDEEQEVKFTLTSEAGLNDGLAFPFVYLAVFFALGKYSSGDMLDWFGEYVLWKIGAGVLIGYLLGRLIGKFFFSKQNPTLYSDGFVVVAITILSYGVTEIFNGYGFIGVFVAAYVFRRQEKKHSYHKKLHDFAGQIEHLFLAVLIIFFGMAIQQGLLKSLDILGVVIAVGFIFLIRPLGGLLALLGRKISFREKYYISFLGIRGIGSFYYLSYALNHAPFPEADSRKIWAVAGLIVLISIIVHGFYAPRWMRKLLS